MKNIKILVLLVTVSIILSSCYKETYWVDDNVTSEGKHFPVIQSTYINNTPASGKFAEGAVVEFGIRYWSIDPIKEFQLFATLDGTETLASTTPYSLSFNPETSAEDRIINYTVPAGSSGKTIGLKCVVVNDNGLTRTASRNISVE